MILYRKNIDRKMFFIIIIISCLATINTAIPLDVKIYHNEESGYRIEYPDTWDVVEAKPRENTPRGLIINMLEGDELQEVAFIDKSPGSEGMGRFDICVVSNKDDLTIREWAEKTFVDAFDLSVAYDFEQASLHSRPAVKFTVFEFDQTCSVIACKSGSRIYYLHFPVSSPNDPIFEVHKNVYARMTTSFQFTNGNSE
ncbi:hypothetical protein ACFL6G_04935 [candidate division KSB1 bacterium]